MPSDTEMVVNSRGVPPAAATPSLAASTCGPCVMLQGVVSPFWLTTPIIGLAIAASSSPIARMKARCGVRSRPSVVMRERSGISALGRRSARGLPASRMLRILRASASAVNGLVSRSMSGSSRP